MYKKKLWSVVSLVALVSSPAYADSLDADSSGRTTERVDTSTIRWEADGVRDGNTRHNFRSPRDPFVWHSNDPAELNDPENFPDSLYNAMGCFGTLGNSDYVYFYRFQETPRSDGVNCEIDSRYPLSYEFRGNWPDKAKWDVGDVIRRITDMENTREPGLSLTMRIYPVQPGGTPNLVFQWGGAPEDTLANTTVIPGAGQATVAIQEAHGDSPWRYGVDEADFYLTFLHEFGHALGLTHVKEGIMSYDWEPLQSEGELRKVLDSENDGMFEGIRDLYSRPDVPEVATPFLDTDAQGGASLGMHGWTMKEGDIHVAGDFTGNGLDERISIHPTSGWSKVQSFQGGTWVDVASNSGSGYLPRSLGGLYWELGEGDRIVAGDFTGNGRDELFLYNRDEETQATMGLSGDHWTSLAINNPSVTVLGNIDVSDLPNMDPGSGEMVLVGRFTGQAYDEMLLVRPAGVSILRFDQPARNWKVVLDSVPLEETPFGALGGERPTKFAVGDFDGDPSSDEIFVAGADGRYTLVGTSMDAIETYKAFEEGDAEPPSAFETWASGTRTVGTWALGPKDRIIAGNFVPGTSNDELFVYDEKHHAQVLGIEDSTWSTVASNEGTAHVAMHRIGMSDEVLAGNFERSSASSLLTMSSKTTSWYLDSLPATQVKADAVGGEVSGDDELSPAGCRVGGDSSGALLFGLLPVLMFVRRRRTS